MTIPELNLERTPSGSQRRSRQAEPMPQPVKWVLYAIAIPFAVFALVLASSVFSGSAPASVLLIAAGIFAVVVGLLRRLAWARFIFSGFSVLASFAISNAVLFGLSPDIELPNGRGFIERYFTSTPPMWVAWLFAMVAAILILMPAVIIGRRRAWFKASIW